jgi:hypothetical protein
MRKLMKRLVFADGWIGDLFVHTSYIRRFRDCSPMPGSLSRTAYDEQDRRVRIGRRTLRRLAA